VYTGFVRYPALDTLKIAGMRKVPEAACRFDSFDQITRRHPDGDITAAAKAVPMTAGCCAHVFEERYRRGYYNGNITERDIHGTPPMQQFAPSTLIDKLK
jgi:hypothetical protein